MANFRTHLNGAAIVSGLAAATLLSAGNLDPISAIWMTCLGTIGGLLPDVDSKHSKSMKVIFRALGIVVAFSMLCHFYSRISLLPLLVLVIGSYCLIRYGARKLLARYTIHRATCHCIAFVVLIGMILVCVMNQLEYQAKFSWLSGIFLILGGLVHLTLDEIYSVDLSNKRMKKSFGTAFRLTCPKYPWISLCQVSAIVFLFAFTPPFHPAWNALTDWSHFALGPNWLNFHEAGEFFSHFYETISNELRHLF